MTVAGQDAKYVQMIPPAAILDNTSATEVEVDTLGYHYAEFICTLGATDIALTALKLQETDTSGSGEADVTGSVFGTATDIDGTATVLPSATDDDQIIVFQVDLRKRKRYMSCVATFGDGTAGGFISGLCRLSRGDVAETTSAAMATGGVVRL